MTDDEQQKVVDANDSDSAYDIRKVSELNVADKKGPYMSKDDFKSKFIDPLDDAGDDDDF